MAAGQEQSRDLWEDHASWWLERFTDGADPEYTEQIIPMALSELSACGTVLDIGTGDGQIARALAAEGASVVGLDPTAGVLATAVERGGGVVYVRGASDRLPFPDAHFEGVCACLVFEHIDALEDSIAEVARVLRRGGRFAFFLNHPLTQSPGSAWVEDWTQPSSDYLRTPGSGWIDDHMVDPAEQYWRIGPYLVEQDTVEQVELGVFIRFVHRPLSRYMNSLAEHGLVLERMVEPRPPDGFLARAAEYEAAAAIPRLLYLRLRRT